MCCREKDPSTTRTEHHALDRPQRPLGDVRTEMAVRKGAAGMGRPDIVVSHDGGWQVAEKSSTWWLILNPPEADLRGGSFCQ